LNEGSDGADVTSGDSPFQTYAVWYLMNVILPYLQSTRLYHIIGAYAIFMNPTIYPLCTFPFLFQYVFSIF